MTHRKCVIHVILMVHCHFVFMDGNCVFHLSYYFCQATVILVNGGSDIIRHISGAYTRWFTLSVKFQPKKCLPWNSLQLKCCFVLRKRSTQKGHLLFLRNSDSRCRSWDRLLSLSQTNRSDLEWLELSLSTSENQHSPVTLFDTSV